LTHLDMTSTSSLLFDLLTREMASQIPSMTLTASGAVKFNM